MTDEIKSGNRNNANDRGTIRQVRRLANEIVNHTMALEPLDEDPTPEPSEITEFPLKMDGGAISFISDLMGGSVKAGDE